MRHLLGFVIGIALVLSTPISHADQSDSTTMHDAAGLCSNAGPADAQYLPEVRAGALDVRKALCVGSGSQDEVYRAFVNFLVTNRDKWFAPYGSFQAETDPLSVVLEDALATEQIELFAPFTIGLSPDDNVTVNGMVLRPINTSNCPKNGCGPVFDELRAFYTYAQNTIASPGAQVVANSLAGLSTQWERYLEESRSQTLIELYVNSRLYRKNSTAAFGPPPKGQMILLHPNVVIENVRDAVKGQQTKEALMIELIGYNRWQHHRPYAVTGGSVTALYSDRVDVKSVGYGVALHIGNQFTVGYSNRDGEHGFFISMDLLKPLQDKAGVVKELIR